VVRNNRYTELPSSSQEDAPISSSSPSKKSALKVDTDQKPLNSSDFNLMSSLEAESVKVQPGSPTALFGNFADSSSDDLQTKLIKLNKSKAWLKSEITSWIKDFEQKNDRKPSDEEKFEIEDRYIAYQVVKQCIAEITSKL
jgi:hypothetical protein